MARTVDEWREKFRDKWRNEVFPPRLVRALEEFEPAIDDIDERIESLEPGEGFCIWGPTGAGKTVLAAMIMDRIREKEYLKGVDGKFLFIDVPRLLIEIRSSFEDPRIHQTEIIDRYSRVDWLCLDDLGAERPSEWVTEMLYVIINNRYMNYKPTIFTTQYSPNKLSSKFRDTRVASRILGMSKFIRLLGKDKKWMNS